MTQLLKRSRDVERTNKSWHGSPLVEEGKLRGATDTDFFYFLCPTCDGDRMLQVRDLKTLADGPVKYAPDVRPGARRDFIIAFELYCPECRLTDFTKIGNIGWQGGRLPAWERD